MNKTIIININGTVFHIEEQAYELLKAYMTEVKRHFYNSADSLEITTDIENRIAEMFSEILIHENRQALVEHDVIYVTEQMGSVKDFEEVDNETETFTDAAYRDNGGNRKLFRDPDDHLVGGVCAGIAKYFDTRAVYVRLAFAITLAFAGSGLLLYIILWIILPKAATRADRMAMRGEKLDLQGFKRSFEAELNMVGGRLVDVSEEARPLVYKTRDFLGDFFHHLGGFLGGAGKAIIKLLGIALILILTGCIVAIIVGLVALWVFSNNEFLTLPEIFLDYTYINQVYAALALMLIIPFISIIILISRAVFNTAGMSRSVAYTLLMVWISAIVVFAYHASKTAVQFKESAGFTREISIKPTANQVYSLKLNDVMFFTAEDSARLDIKNKFRDLTLTDDRDDEYNHRTVILNIELSDKPYPVLSESFSASGPNYEAALLNARNTRYMFEQQDSVLKFDYKLRRPIGEPWHSEEVRLTLKLPLNAIIKIDKKLRFMANYIDLDNCHVKDEDYSDNLPAMFIMTERGLECKANLEKEAEAKKLESARPSTVFTDTTTTVSDSISNGDTTIIITKKAIIRRPKGE